jgi:hypothetical protein
VQTVPTGCAEVRSTREKCLTKARKLAKKWNVAHTVATVSFLEFAKKDGRKFFRVYV